ncbi:SOSS complex subunit B2 [Orchesella cincta]|uniref:SOSS complex subunit B2 n=1 Tax=Orchesella cincta TaxID=48709 RepID=A0A1D2N963_ORCCI|nr:SOSS complex subunit B2 [Orchesella cincta]
MDQRMNEAPLVVVKDLRPGLKNLTMVLITLEIGKPSTTKDGHEVRSMRVADRTGSVNLSIWDEPGTLLQPGDIIRVQKAYASLFKSSLTLYIGKGGEIYKVGDFCLHFSETPNMSEESFTNPAELAPSERSGGPGGQQGGRGGGPPSSEGKGIMGSGPMGGGGGNRGVDRPGYGNPGPPGVNRMGMGMKHILGNHHHNNR